MQATPAPTPTDIAAQLAAEIQQAHRDALRTLHKLMLEAAESLTKPPEEEPSRVNATTQRIRLCFQMAREILRLRSPGDLPPTRRHQPRARAEHDDQPSDTPSTSAAELLATAGAAPSQPAQHTNPPADTPLTTIDSAARPYTPLRIPPELTHAERLQYLRADRRHGIFPLPLYIRLVEWYHYAQATGERAPFNTSLEKLQRRRPPNGPDPQVPPINAPTRAAG